MKRAIILHGWYGYSDEGWRPWLKTELEKLGYQMMIPQMPDTEKPNMEAWLTKLTEVIGDPDEGLVLIGHSLGCITILRYLERLQDDQKIGGAFLVAGFAKDLTFSDYHGELANFFQTPVLWDNIKAHCPKFWIINSDDDPYVTGDNHEILVQNLNASGHWEHDKKHMSGDDGVFELDSVLDAEFIN